MLKAKFGLVIFNAWILAALATAVHAAPPTTRPAAFEKDIAAFEKADVAHPPPADANLFIGSSSIAKWKTLAEDFAGVPTIRRGFGGSRIVDSTRYVPRIVIPYHPKRIFLYAGDNDLAGGRSPQEVAEDFADFVKAVRAGLPQTPIYFISIKPSPLRARLLDKVREANGLIEASTKTGENLHYIDVFTPMLDAGGRPRGELFGFDRLHMNAKGYALWTAIIAPELK